MKITGLKGHTNMGKHYVTTLTGGSAKRKDISWLRKDIKCSAVQNNERKCISSAKENVADDYWLLYASAFDALTACSCVITGEQSGIAVRTSHAHLLQMRSLL